MTAVSTDGLGRSSNIPELLVILQKRVTGTWTAAFPWAPASHAGAGAWTGEFSGFRRLELQWPEGHTLHLGRGARLCLMGHSGCGHSATFWPEVTLARDFPRV